MPHIKIEHSDNIHQKHITLLLPKIHDLLVKKLPTEINSCKSRIHTCKDFLVGDNKVHKSFLHLEIRVLKGRIPILLESLAKEIMLILNDGLKQFIVSLNPAISVEITELSDFYYKN